MQPTAVHMYIARFYSMFGYFFNIMHERLKVLDIKEYLLFLIISDNFTIVFLFHFGNPQRHT